jgi:diguanylate cyclase (GGDEF)-like protein
MTPILKAQFRERLMRDLAERSIPGIPAYIAIWSVVIFASGFHDTHTTVAYPAWIGFLIVSALRLVYQLTHQGLFRFSPTLSYGLFLTSILIPAGLWGALFVYCILGPNTEDFRLLMVMATAGLCSGAMTSFAPDRRIAITYLLIVLLPACFAIAWFNPEETPLLYLMLSYIVFTLLQLTRGSREYWSALENEAALAEKTRQLEDISKIDGLTGIYNRRHFNQILDLEWKRGSRENRLLTLIMLDIDHFKHINDTFGHLAGDDYLKSIAAILKGSFKRCTDVIARYGGEEFAILLPATPLADAAILAESLRQNVAEHRSKSGKIHLRATVSLGLASCIPDHKTPPEHLISLADKALYQAKTAGRNQVRYDAQTHPVQACSPGDTDGGNAIHLETSPGISASKG